MLPAITGGILNMAFVKLPIIKWAQIPIDGGRSLADGKRIFGGGKTWKGFFGMIVFTALSALLFWRGAFSYSFLRGAWLGFAYVLFELPNSFIKRRLGLKPGVNGGVAQTVVDQADSAIGFALFLAVIHPMAWHEIIALIILSTATHYLFNILLYYLKLRGQKG